MKLAKLATFKAVQPFRLSHYAELSKSKLSAFVLLTTMAGYAVAPGVSSLSTLLLTTIGTGLQVTSANSINQWTERHLDAQMIRTRYRVLVRWALTPHHAFLFGTATGLIGTVLLYSVSPLAALIGFSNIVLYTCVYTPLKRISIYNTWAGALVGGLPPLMGWIACTGSLDPGGLLLTAVLFAWQFPHFNALSWADYARAGYHMMSVIDPAMNARVSLRYSVLLFPVSFGFWWCGVSSAWFLLNSTLVNSYMAYYAFNFWKQSNEKNARKLFFSSLVHLPVFLILLMFHKVEREDSLDKASTTNEIYKSSN